MSPETADRLGECLLPSAEELQARVGAPLTKEERIAVVDNFCTQLREAMLAAVENRQTFRTNARADTEIDEIETNKRGCVYRRYTGASRWLVEIDAPGVGK